MSTNIVEQNMSEAAKLNVCCNELIEMFEKNGVSEEQLEKLRGMIERKEQAMLMEVATSFQTSMPFIDHDELCNKLYKGWEALNLYMRADIVKLKKKIENMHQDKKHDPNVLDRLERSLEDAEKKGGMVSVMAGQMQLECTIGVAKFKDESFDGYQHYTKSKSKPSPKEEEILQFEKEPDPALDGVTSALPAK